VLPISTRQNLCAEVLGSRHRTEAGFTLSETDREHRSGIQQPATAEFDPEPAFELAGVMSGIGI
jgi:hypothetical protein